MGPVEAELRLYSNPASFALRGSSAAWVVFLGARAQWLSRRPDLDSGVKAFPDLMSEAIEAAALRL